MLARRESGINFARRGYPQLEENSMLNRTPNRPFIRGLLSLLGLVLTQACVSGAGDGNALPGSSAGSGANGGAASGGQGSGGGNTSAAGQAAGGSAGAASAGASNGGA